MDRVCLHERANKSSPHWHAAFFCADNGTKSFGENAGRSFWPLGGCASTYWCWSASVGVTRRIVRAADVDLGGALGWAVTDMLAASLQGALGNAPAGISSVRTEGDLRAVPAIELIQQRAHLALACGFLFS